MISRDDLLQHPYSPGPAADMPLMESYEFHAHQLRHSTLNQRFAMHCGEKENFPSPLVFWLWSFQCAEGPDAGDRAFRQAADESVCEAISNRKCFDILDHYYGAIKRSPPDFLLRQDLLWAEIVLRGVALGCSRMSLLAEFEEVFIAIHNRIPL